jgi:hypothetical protein
MAVLIVAAGLFALTAGSASAAVAPTHAYYVHCLRSGYWGDYITAQATDLEPQPGLTAVIGGPGGGRASQDQYIYYRVWAYSYATQTWYHSAAKRVVDGQLDSVEAWNASRGAWTAPAAGFDYAPTTTDAAIGLYEVGLRIAPGSGRWYFTVQTYWTPPFTVWPSPYDPRIPSGGLNVYDTTGTCSF